jgi:D-tyrosyl-tRNA(Tyr) deacylase
VFAMIALIQRVTQASVSIDKESIAEIETGILVLLGVEKQDTEKTADDLLHKVINYRIFEDQNQKMNLSLLDIKGELLIVPQFTLPANTQKGLRPSFASAAPPEQGKQLYQHFIHLAKEKVEDVQTGRFGADMQVSLTNNGPVTFWLQK